MVIFHTYVCSLWERFPKRNGKIHHAINGKTDYFYWAMFNSYVKLPEGKPSKILGQDHTILRSLPKHI